MKPVPIAMLLALLLSTALVAGAQQHTPGFSTQNAAPARPGGPPAAQSDAARVLASRYTLASSTSAPDARWVYSKARIKVQRLDQRHLVLYFSCEWARWPKDACYDWWVVRQRPDGLFLQDLNTGAMGMRIDPASGTLTMTMAGAGEDVRTDVFIPDAAPQASAVLERRMRRAEASFAATVAEPAFGKPARWDFTRLRIHPPLP